MNNDETLKKLYSYITVRLNEIEKCFLSAKVTLLVRNPDLKDHDLLFSVDDPKKVMESIKKLSKKEPSDEVL